MKTFMEYSKKFANPDRVIVSDDACDIPEEYIHSVDVLVNIMAPKMSVLENVSVPFIQETLDGINFSDMPNEDIPDDIFNVLSLKLYHLGFNDITDDEQAVIKTLTAYVVCK